MSLAYRGVCYDIGTNYLSDGGLSRPRLSEATMAADLRTIREQLHANAVAVYGTDPARLTAAATLAIELGLHVFLQPRLIDAGPPQTLELLAEVAGIAQKLRDSGADITLNVGCELTLFSTGIIPGPTFQERTSRLSSPRTWPLVPWYNRRLNHLLEQCVVTARQRFDGPLTYSGGMWEKVDWRRFDIVGLDYYRMRQNRRGYESRLSRMRGQGKPVVITEFGCAAHVGAKDVGPMAHQIVDHSVVPAQVPATYVRDEQTQASEIAALLNLYDRLDLAGAFVFEFVEPYYPYSTDPRYDLDMAGYALVRTLAGPGGDSDRWEPKAAFHEVARIFAAL